VKCVGSSHGVSEAQQELQLAAHSLPQVVLCHISDVEGQCLPEAMCIGLHLAAADCVIVAA